MKKSLIALTLIALPVPPIRSDGWFGDPAGKLAESLKYFGDSVKEASQNLDPAKVQEITAEIQKTLQATTNQLASSIAKAFHDTHHTVIHQIDYNSITHGGLVICGVGVFLTSLGLVYTSLTHTQQSARRTAIQATIGSIGLLGGSWWLTQ